MSRKITVTALLWTLTLTGASFAGPREDLLARYAAEAKTASASFPGFASARGQTLHQQKFTGGKRDTPACTSCHGSDVRSVGRSPVGKPIDPVAVSVSPYRYTDPAKVEKWFKRNCNEVLGRECTSLEKGDWLTYMMSQ